jgi:3-deoxy-manno-octulosonate cytidylyltransferase (CMP-KDO synthetase)
MKRLIVIPARYASTRLPGKPLRQILGKPLIQWVYESACRSSLQDGALIATDDERILEKARSFGAEAVMTSRSCRSGTDRVCEAARGKGADIIVNLQGDEPEIRADMIDSLFAVIEKEQVQMATLCTPLTLPEEFNDPNVVKVVLDRSGFALYFSRAPIPFFREQSGAAVYKHVGVYGFTMPFLERFVSMEKSLLEETESLEQLRVLENGYRIKVLVTEYSGTGIDTAEDLAAFTKKLTQNRRTGVPTDIA